MLMPVAQYFIWQALILYSIVYNYHYRKSAEKQSKINFEEL